MPDCMATEIAIGGTISKPMASKLCKVLQETGASLEYGDTLFMPETPDEIIAGVNTASRTLDLCDAERAWGPFEELEAFLQKHEIPYDRHTEGRYEYDSEYVRYRPGIGIRTTPTLRSGDPVVEVALLQPLLKNLTALCESRGIGLQNVARLRAGINEAKQLLMAALPRELPELPPFKLVDKRGAEPKTTKSRKKPHNG